MSNIFKNIRELSLKYEQEKAEFLAKMIQTPSFSMKEKDIIQVIKKDSLSR